MSDVSNGLIGKKVGRFKVRADEAGRLVLVGRLGLGILYLLLSVVILAWAATAWSSVLSGHSETLKAALLISLLALVCLWLCGSTLGARLVFDAGTRSVTRSSFFGMSKKTFTIPNLVYVSVMAVPATPKRREKAFLHLMNDRQAVEVYVTSSRTDRADAIHMLGVAERAGALLQLRPRCEGTPGTSSPAFVEAHSAWAKRCPDGVQSLRRQVI